MLRFVENLENWTTLPGTFTSSSGVGVSINTGRLAITTNSSYAAVILDSQGTWIVNTRINVTSTSTTMGFINFYDGATIQCCLAIKSNGKLAFFRGGSNGTQVGSDSTATLTFDASLTFYDVEIKVVIHNTTGSVAVRVNGTTDSGIASSNVNTRNGSNNSADTVRFGEVLGLASPNMRFDHIIIMDGTGSAMNDFIGPVNVNSHVPTGAGNYSQFTPSTGSNWQNVDDTSPDGDSTYNASGTLNQIDTFQTTDCPSGTTNVLGAQLYWNARRDDATTRGLSPVLRIGGTDYVGNNQNVGPTYQYFTQIYEVSPATSVAFTPSEVNGLEIGYKVTT